MADQSNEELVAGFVAEHRPEAAGEDVFVAPTSEGSARRLYGGALLSRAAVAAALTVDGKLLHSFHAYFLAPGQPGTPVLLEVTRTRDGRSYSNRAVRAVQGDRVLCEAMANFTASQDAGVDADFQPTAPEAPPPESTPDGLALLKDYPNVWMPPQHVPFESRYVDLPWAKGERPETPWRIWVRARAPLPDDPVQHLAACVMTSDWRSNGTLERVFGMPLDVSSTISLDHTITFHRPPRMDDWLLFVTWCTSAVAGRAYMYRQVFTASGDLVMTITQEMAYRDIGHGHLDDRRGAVGVTPA